RRLTRNTAKPGGRRSLQAVRSSLLQDNLQAPAREGVEDKMNTALLRSAFLFLAVQFSLLAQNNSQLAHLSGTLSDASGSGIGDVLVHARAEGSSNSLTWS